jgi:hypothetical protein
MQPEAYPNDWPTAIALPTTATGAYGLGLQAGRRREDPVSLCYAYIVAARQANDDFLYAELITSFHTGWLQGSRKWFDAGDFPDEFA